MLFSVSVRRKKLLCAAWPSSDGSIPNDALKISYNRLMERASQKTTFINSTLSRFAYRSQLLKFWELRL